MELQLTQLPLQRSQLSQNKRLRNSLRSRCGKYDGIIVALAEECRISRSQVLCHDLVSEHSLDHQLNPELDSRPACALAADHVLALEAKAGNSVALLRPVCLVVHGLQMAQARCLPDHPQA